MFRSLIRWAFFCLCVAFTAGVQPGWSQAANPTPGAPGVPLKTAPSPAPAAVIPPPSKLPDTTVVPLDAPVITIDGLCEHSGDPAEKSPPADCKTVITRAEFEKIVNTIQPDLPVVQQRQLAGNYASAVMMSHEAHRLGLDKGPEYEERLRLATLQVQAQLAMKNARAQATEVSDKEVSDYYQAHLAQYDQASAEQLFIPLRKQSSAKTAGTPAPTPAESAAEMKKEAEALRARAASGEDFVKLQAEASQFAGLKTPPPDVHVPSLRRTSLSPARSSVMDLKPGEVSPVIADPTGFFVYKIEKKESQPLDQVRSEIVTQLKTQKGQAAMQALQHLGTPKLEDKYFGAAGPTPGAFPPRSPGAPPAAAGRPPVAPAPKAVPGAKPAAPPSSSTSPSTGPK